MVVRLVLRLRRAVALLRGGGEREDRMDRADGDAARMNDLGRRQVLVLGGRLCRAMVGEGGIVNQVILVIEGICFPHLRGLEVIWIGCECLYS